MSLADEKFKAFIETLDPAVAKTVQTASSTETLRYPLASDGLTEQLGGGIVAGRVHLVYGDTSGGKSSLIMESIGNWQRDLGLVCVYADIEGTYTKEWGERLGVNNDALILMQKGIKSSGRLEKAVVPFVQKGVDVLVIDSISDIMPEVFIDEKTGEMNDQDKRKQTGAHAKAITKLIGGLLYENHKTAIILISQTTTFLGQNYVVQIPHGGKKTLFASTIVIKINSSNTEGQQLTAKVQVGDKLVEQTVGRKVRAYVEKNKIGKQSGTAEYDFFYSGPFVGVDRVGEAFDKAEALGVIVKSGAWFKWPSHEKNINGRAQFIKFLRNDPEALADLKKESHTMLTGEVDE